MRSLHVTPARNEVSLNQHDRLRGWVGKARVGSVDVSTFSDQAHADISPPGVGMLRSILDNCISAQGGQRRVVTSVSTFHSVPAILSGTKLLAIDPRRAAMSMSKNIVSIRELSFDIAPYAVSLWCHNSTRNDPLLRRLREQVLLLTAKLV